MWLPNICLQSDRLIPYFTPRILDDTNEVTDAACVSIDIALQPKF